MENIKYPPFANRSEKKTLNEIKSRLSGFEGVEKVIFFGSRLRGDFTGESDFDILVIVDSKDLKFEVIDIIGEIEMQLGVPISPSIYTTVELEENMRLGSPFFKHVFDEGMILYETQR